MTPPDRRILAYFGHHKCASTWIASIVATVAADVGLSHMVVVDELTPESRGPLTDYVAAFERDQLRERADAIGADIVACVTADRQQAEALRAYRAFHVIRDPRDIVVSAYFSHRDTHPVHGLPHMQAHREALRAATIEEGLLLEMEFSKAELLQMSDWDYASESVLEIKMEDLTLHPYEWFLQVFGHLGLLEDVEPRQAAAQARVWTSRLLNRLARRHRGLSPVRRKMRATGELVLGAVYANRFEALTAGRRRGSEDLTSHYRKGVAGDWANHFTPVHAEAFRAHFGDLLERLGYGSDPDPAGIGH